MTRWDIVQHEARRNLELSLQNEQTPQKQTGSNVSLGRGASDNLTSKQTERAPERHQQDRAGVSRSRGARNVERGDKYRLREREIRAMTDIGTFRTVDPQDLAHFAYKGDSRAMNYDLGELRTHGLIEEKVLVRAHRTPRRILALTQKGHRILRKAGDLPKHQALYHGFVKPREIEHDADLYKVYQQAVEEIRAKGGKPVRVRLDFAMKSAIQRERNATKSLSDDERTKHLAAFAVQQSLTMTGGRIHVPDVQIEYETRDGSLERTNLELVSENYRTEGIRTKAESGFAIYARGGDTSRVRRALQDTHTIERILSI